VSRADPVVIPQAAYHDGGGGHFQSASLSLTFHLACTCIPRKPRARQYALDAVLSVTYCPKIAGYPNPSSSVLQTCNTLHGHFLRESILQVAVVSLFRSQHLVFHTSPRRNAVGRGRPVGVWALLLTEDLNHIDQKAINRTVIGVAHSIPLDLSTAPSIPHRWRLSGPVFPFLFSCHSNAITHLSQVSQVFCKLSEAACAGN
jgi:hypothetical protein